MMLDSLIVRKLGGCKIEQTTFTQFFRNMKKTVKLRSTTETCKADRTV